MAQASDVLAVAVKEIGTVEQSGNRQKYGKAYGMDGVYWCMQFVWWCFLQADKTLFMSGGKTASCGELMRWAQAHGQWVTTGYRPGDVLIYDLPGTAYKYGSDLIRKLATMKQFARFGQNSKGCVQRGHSLIHDNIFDNKTVPKHSETAQKFPLRPYLLRQNFGCWENEKTLKLQ